MAAVLVVPTGSRTNRPLTISGTGFAVSSPVTITIPQENMRLVATTDVSGNFDTAAVWSWSPSRTGKLTVIANDGATTKTADVMIYSTT